jgi:hypothetical protein
MPYCMTHHYRIHPDTGDVIKLAGCFVFVFRERLEKEAALASGDRNEIS